MTVLLVLSFLVSFYEEHLVFTILVILALLGQHFFMG